MPQDPRAHTIRWHIRVAVLVWQVRRPGQGRPGIRNCCSSGREQQVNDRIDEYPLIGTTKMDRLERRALTWPGTPLEKKLEIIERMTHLASSPTTGAREAVSAAKFLLQADKLSLEVEKDLPVRQTNNVQVNHYVESLTTEDIHRILETGEWPEHIKRPGG